MTLKIEKDFTGWPITLRLIGRLRSGDLEELRSQVMGNGPLVVLSLEDVSLVDVATVRFLGACEAEGVKLRHCPPYIREWISREQKRGTQ